MTNIFKKINKFRKVAIWLLVGLNIVLAGGYTYSVNRTVFNVVASEKSSKVLAQNNAKLADLESKYIALSSDLTLDFAYAQGYQDASGHQIYVPNKNAPVGLSFNAR